MQRSRSEKLDVLRGVAIALVIGFHFWPTLLPFGWVGVDLFFVLSGYLIGGILLDNVGTPGLFSVFYARRAFRILPLYWLLLLVALTQKLDQPLWWYLGFGQNFGWIIKRSFPNGYPLSVTWSLAFEEQFYLILPALIAFLPRRWLIAFLWASVIMAPICRFAFMHHPFIARLLLPARLDSLMGGVLLACFVRRYARSGATWLLLSFVAPCLDLALHHFDLSWHTPPISLFVLGFVAALWAAIKTPEVRLTFLRPIAWLGIGSYSIYLFHLPILELTRTTALAVPVTMAVALFSWCAVEHPLIRFARKRWRYTCRAVQAADMPMPSKVAIPAV